MPPLKNTSSSTSNIPPPLTHHLSHLGTRSTNHAMVRSNPAPVTSPQAEHSPSPIKKSSHFPYQNIEKWGTKKVLYASLKVTWEFKHDFWFSCMSFTEFLVRVRTNTKLCNQYYCDYHFCHHLLEVGREGQPFALVDMRLTCVCLHRDSNFYLDFVLQLLCICCIVQYCNC